MYNSGSNSEETVTNGTFDFQKLIEPFSEKDYNEDYILTNSILRHQLKQLDPSNYGKYPIYDKDEMDSFKDTLIDKYNRRYFPYELCFNTHRNIYKEEKKLINFSEKLRKKELKDYEEKDEELYDKDRENYKEKEQEKDKSEHGEMSDEELRSEGDYNFDYNRSEDEFENEENDEHTI